MEFALADFLLQPELVVDELGDLREAAHEAPVAKGIRYVGHGESPR